MAEMTTRERICAAFEHREPDRTPVYDLLRNEAAIAHYAGEAVTFDNWERVIPLAISRALDLTRSVRGPQRPRRVEHEDGRVDVLQRWTTWHTVKRIRSEKDLLAHFRRHAEAGPPTAEALRDQAAQTIAWHQDWQRRIQPALHVWQICSVGLMGAHGTAGLELFSYALADDPETVIAFLDMFSRRQVERIHEIFRQVTPEIKAQLAPVAFAGDDIAYKSGPMFSRPDLERLFFPYLKRLCDAFHEHGIWVMFHSDGDLTAIMERLVECGIDGLNPIERNAGMDLAQLKRDHGEQVTFCGGIDINTLLRCGSVADAEEGTRQAIREAGENGGYLAGSTTELDNELPGENVVAMIETAKQTRYRALVSGADRER